jgi:DNA mismatch repair protein MutS2
VLEILEEAVEKLEEKAEKPVRRRVPKLGAEPLQRPVRLGDHVRLRTLNTQGVVTAMGEEEAEVRVGMLRVRARLSDLQPLSEASPSQGPVPAPVADRLASPVELPASPGFELDLRGQRADEALESLERYLDSAYLSGLPFVRIIHGKGTGKLRQAVRQTLHNHSQVSSFEAGKDQEGGDGVTIARLRSS